MLGAEEIYTVIEERLPGGEIARKRVAYVRPVFPVREFVIVEPGSGSVLMETPGGSREVVEVIDGKKKVRTVARPFVVLKLRHDQMHATRYTFGEAGARCVKWGLGSEDFQVMKESDFRGSTNDTKGANERR